MGEIGRLHSSETLQSKLSGKKNILTTLGGFFFCARSPLTPTAKATGEPALSMRMSEQQRLLCFYFLFYFFFSLFLMFVLWWGCWGWWCACVRACVRVPDTKCVRTPPGLRTNKAQIMSALVSSAESEKQLKTLPVCAHKSLCAHDTKKSP